VSDLTAAELVDSFEQRRNPVETLVVENGEDVFRLAVFSPSHAVRLLLLNPRDVRYDDESR